MFYLQAPDFKVSSLPWAMAWAGSLFPRPGVRWNRVSAHSACPPLSSLPKCPPAGTTPLLGGHWSLAPLKPLLLLPAVASNFGAGGTTHLSPLLDPHFVESTEVCGGGRKLMSISQACGGLRVLCRPLCRECRGEPRRVQGLHHRAGATRAPGTALSQWREPGSDDRRPTVWTSWLRGPVGSPSACSSLS